MVRASYEEAIKTQSTQKPHAVARRDCAPPGRAVLAQHAGRPKIDVDIEASGMPVNAGRNKSRRPPRTKHRPHRAKGYEVAASDKTEDDEPANGGTKVPQPGRPKRTTPKRSKRAPVQIAASPSSTAPLPGSSCRAISLTFAFAAAGLLGIAYTLRKAAGQMVTKAKQHAPLAPTGFVPPLPQAPPPPMPLMPSPMLPSAPRLPPPMPRLPPPPMLPPPQPPTPTPPPPSPSPPPDAACYALRYHDLLAGFCGGKLNGCDLAALQAHWETAGQTEGRQFACVLEPPSPPPPHSPPHPPTPPSAPPSPPSPPSPPGQPPPWVSLFRRGHGPSSSAETINERFRRPPYTKWPASGELPDAGVLIHLFDTWDLQDDYSKGTYVRWRPGRGAMSASFLWADQKPSCCEMPIPTFVARASGLHGIVFRPGVSTRVLCAQDRDMSGGGCTRWTWPLKDIGSRLRSSSDGAKTYINQNGRGELGYNEFQIDGQWWDRHLPDAVDAFVGDSAEARQQHAAFLRQYGLSADQVPLLSMDVGNWYSPFG